MVVVIADAGPLIGLAKIQQLDLLKDLFVNVLITRAVAEECLRCSSLDAVLIRQAIDAGWLQNVADPVLQHGLSKSLGLGEQTSIELALSISEKTVLVIDDALARKQAMRKKLTIVGTAAVIFAAQRKGLIVDAEVLIDQLRAVGYRISVDVVEQLKRC